MRVGGISNVLFFFFFFPLTDGTAVAELLRVAGNPHNLLARGNNNDHGNSSLILVRLFIGFKVLLHLFLHEHLTI